MTNRNKLFCLIAVTTVLAVVDGCTVGDSDPVFGKSAYKQDQKGSRDGATMIDSLRDNPDDCDHDPCADPDTFHIGCPGYPCAHGSCFEGECVGRTTDEDGYQIDPGVCCTPEFCDGEV